MVKKAKEVDFGMLPRVEGTVAYEDKLIMYDNLDTPIYEALTNDILTFIGDLPKRISFAFILVCLKGRIDIRCNLKDFSIEERGLMVMVPGTICESLSFSKDCTLLALSVPDQNYAPGPSFENATYVQRNFTSPIALRLDEDVLQSGVNIFKQLKAALQKKGNAANDELVRAYITVMAGLAAVNLQKSLIDNPPESVSTKELVLKNFLSSVENDHRKARDVSYYAEKAGLSPKYFAKIIKATSGKHPMEWIMEYTVLDMKSVLKSHECSISQACSLFGFSSRSQFDKYFKKVAGCTPAEYVRS